MEQVGRYSRNLNGDDQESKHSSMANMFFINTISVIPSKIGKHPLINDKTKELGSSKVLNKTPRHPKRTVGHMHPNIVTMNSANHDHGASSDSSHAKISKKRMYNPKNNIVLDSIQGVLAASGGDLARLDYQNSVKVVVRNDEAAQKKDKVALISGGGSGHNPSHAGWVGKGMLTAAVSGDVFASPSTEAVLAAIKAVSSNDHGCMIIVKNYTGDRLNFGMAVEKAKKNGIPCQMLVVGDDVAIENAPQPRGIAGVVLIHKVAGAAAEKGYDLQKVHEIAHAASKNVFSIGMSMTVCSQPGSVIADRLDDHTVEYGLGIHGEPGVERREIQSSKETCAHLVDYLTKRIKDKTKPFAVFINNLGTLPPIEMEVVVGDSCEALHNAGFTNIQSIMVNSAMTSLDMSGFSISLLDTSCHPEIPSLLEAPTTAKSWIPPVRYIREIAVLPCPPPEQVWFEPPKELSAEGKKVKELIRAAAMAIVDAEPELTQADLIVGDGDCGQTLKLGADRILKDLDRYPLNSKSDTLAAMAVSIGNSMGGTSGILYSLGFNAAAAVVDKEGWLGALRKGTEAIMFYGGAKAGMRTMLDALVPAIQGTNADDVAKRAAEGAKSTGAMGKAGAGRSSYVPPEALKGTPDPGATAVGVWLSAIAKASKK